MDPPYRRGVHFLEMKRHFGKYRWTTEMFKELMWIVFGKMARMDAFYCD